MQQKRGQIYIISAIIIIIILISMMGVSNYILTKKEPKEVYSLSENLEIEGASIIDYSIYQTANTQEKIDNFFANFTDYFIQSNEKFELIIIYGNKTAATKTTYSTIPTGTIEAGEARIPTENRWNSTTTHFTEVTEVNISGNVHRIELKENENFLFALTTSSDFENFVSGNINN